MKPPKSQKTTRRLDILAKAVHELISEVHNLRALSLGTHKTIKKMPGYSEAIDELKQEYKEEENDKKLEL